MLTIVCIKDRSDCGGFVLSAIYTFISFGCSGFDGFKDAEDFNKLRPISKTVYAIVLSAFFVVFGVTFAPGLFQNSDHQISSTLDTSIFIPQNCTNLCLREGVNYNQTQ